MAPILTLFLFTKPNYITLLELNWLLSQILIFILFQFELFELGRQDENSSLGNSYYSILDINHQAWNMTLMLKGWLENRWKEMILYHQREMIRYTKFQFLMGYHIIYIYIIFLYISVYPSSQLLKTTKNHSSSSFFWMYMSLLLPHRIVFNNKIYWEWVLPFYSVFITIAVIKATMLSSRTIPVAS